MDDKSNAGAPAPDLVTSAGPIDAPTASAETPAAGIPTADRGLGAPTSADVIPPKGDTLAEQIDSLHADMLGGTELGNHTELWNLVHAFKERVKALVAAFERAV